VKSVPHHSFSILIFSVLCGLLQVESGLVFEPLGQRLEFFLLLIIFLWWVLVHAHKMFSEMCMRH
jgi:hypothetical protein